MFDLFKQDIKIGDKVKLYLTTGKEPEGIVVSTGENFVLLQASDKTQNRFFDKLIGGWDLVTTDDSGITNTEEIRLSRICREYEIGLKELVSFLDKKGIRVDVNPNAKITNQELNRIKEELSILANNTSIDLKDFVKHTIVNEDKSNPYSDSMLWRLYTQSSGIKVKRKRIVQARKE